MDIFKHHARLISWDILKARTLGYDYPYAQAKFDALKPELTGSPLECAKAEYVSALHNLYNSGVVSPGRTVIDSIPDLACGDLSGSQLTCAGNTSVVGTDGLVYTTEAPPLAADHVWNANYSTLTLRALTTQAGATYQWYDAAGATIAGATTADYVLAAGGLPTYKGGTYSVVVTNPVTGRTSREYVTVDAPDIVTNTSFVDVEFGNNTTARMEYNNLPFATLAAADAVVPASIRAATGTYTGTVNVSQAKNITADGATFNDLRITGPGFKTLIGSPEAPLLQVHSEGQFDVGKTDDLYINGIGSHVDLAISTKIAFISGTDCSLSIKNANVNGYASGSEYSLVTITNSVRPHVYLGRVSNTLPTDHGCVAINYCDGSDSWSNAVVADIGISVNHATGFYHRALLAQGGQVAGGRTYASVAAKQLISFTNEPLAVFNSISLRLEGARVVAMDPNIYASLIQGNVGTVQDLYLQGCTLVAGASATYSINKVGTGTSRVWSYGVYTNKIYHPAILQMAGTAPIVNAATE